MKKPAASSKRKKAHHQVRKTGVAKQRHGVVLRKVPCVSVGSSPHAACQLYRRYGLLIVKGALRHSSMPSFTSLRCTFKHFQKVVAKTWWVENAQGRKLTPKQVLGCKSIRNGSYYCSFIMQGSKKGLNGLLSSLPFGSGDPDVLDAVPGGVVHEECAWVFFGQNENKKRPLFGRAEHTDSVEHAGTWHIQCSGTKTWFVRPLDDLQLWSAAGCSRPQIGTPADPDGQRRLEVRCEQGDLLIISTRLWWHQTQIPFSSSPSLSIARDFRWATDNTVAGRHAASKAASKDDLEMTNVDVPFAPEHMDEGTRILEEKPLLAVQSNKHEYLCCERCAAPIGNPALHLALLHGDVLRRDIERGQASKYRDWAPVDGKVRLGTMPLPVVRPILHGIGGGLFCSRPCRRKGSAKASEVRHFVRRAWDFTKGTPVPPFLVAYITAIAESLKYSDVHRTTAARACADLGKAAPRGRRKLCEVLTQIAKDLDRSAPAWRGRALYEKLSCVQAGLEWPKPNVELDVEHDMVASLTAVRRISKGDAYNLEE